VTGLVAVTTAQFVQGGSVLALVPPGPGENVVFDARRFQLIDFRAVVGQWRTLVRSGNALSLIFANGEMIELAAFFPADFSVPTELLVRIGDDVVISPRDFFHAFVPLEETRAVDPDGTQILGGAYFLPTPVPTPIGSEADPLSLIPGITLAPNGLLPETLGPSLPAEAQQSLQSSPNDPPVLAQAISDQSSPEDTALSFTLPPGTFTDADGDTLIYSATLSNGDPLPAWLAFDPGTRPSPAPRRSTSTARCSSRSPPVTAPTPHPTRSRSTSRR
jgi:hypothetical protein